MKIRNQLAGGLGAIALAALPAVHLSCSGPVIPPDCQMTPPSWAVVGGNVVAHSLLQCAGVPDSIHIAAQLYYLHKEGDWVPTGATAEYHYPGEPLPFPPPAGRAFVVRADGCLVTTYKAEVHVNGVTGAGNPESEHYVFTHKIKHCEPH